MNSSIIILFGICVALILFLVAWHIFRVRIIKKFLSAGVDSIEIKEYPNENNLRIMGFYVLNDNGRCYFNLSEHVATCTFEPGGYYFHIPFFSKIRRNLYFASKFHWASHRHKVSMLRNLLDRSFVSTNLVTNDGNEIIRLLLSLVAKEIPYKYTSFGVGNFQISVPKNHIHVLTELKLTS